MPDDFEIDIASPSEGLVKELEILGKQVREQLMSLVIRGIEESKQDLNDVNISINLYVATMNFCAATLQSTLDNWQALVKKHQEERKKK